MKCILFLETKSILKPAFLFLQVDFYFSPVIQCWPALYCSQRVWQQERPRLFRDPKVLHSVLVQFWGALFSFINLFYLIKNQTTSNINNHGFGSAWDWCHHPSPIYPLMEISTANTGTGLWEKITSVFLKPMTIDKTTGCILEWWTDAML